MRSSLGKHARSSQDICGQTEHAQHGAIRVPSARKRLKMDISMPEDLTATLPSASDAALPLPTEHAQIDNQSATVTRKHESDVMEQKQVFPTAEWDETNDKRQPLSLAHRIVR